MHRCGGGSLVPEYEGVESMLKEFKDFIAKGNVLDLAVAVIIGAGAFITALINFLILAFIIFLLVRWASKLMKKKEEAAGPTEIELLTEIRDALRK